MKTTQTVKTIKKTITSGSGSSGTHISGPPKRIVTSTTTRLVSGSGTGSSQKGLRRSSRGSLIWKKTVLGEKFEYAEKLKEKKNYVLYVAGEGHEKKQIEEIEQLPLPEPPKEKIVEVKQIIDNYGYHESKNIKKQDPRRLSVTHHARLSTPFERTTLKKFSGYTSEPKARYTSTSVNNTRIDTDKSNTIKQYNSFTTKQQKNKNIIPTKLYETYKPVKAEYTKVNKTIKTESKPNKVITRNINTTYQPRNKTITQTSITRTKTEISKIGDRRGGDKIVQKTETKIDNKYQRPAITIKPPSIQVGKNVTKTETTQDGEYIVKVTTTKTQIGKQGKPEERPRGGSVPRPGQRPRNEDLEEKTINIRRNFESPKHGFGGPHGPGFMHPHWPHGPMGPHGFGGPHGPMPHGYEGPHGPMPHGFGGPMPHGFGGPHGPMPHGPFGGPHGPMPHGYEGPHGPMPHGFGGPHGPMPHGPFGGPHGPMPHGYEGPHGPMPHGFGGPHGPMPHGFGGPMPHGPFGGPRGPMPHGFGGPMPHGFGLPHGPMPHGFGGPHGDEGPHGPMPHGFGGPHGPMPHGFGGSMPHGFGGPHGPMPHGFGGPHVPHGGMGGYMRHHGARMEIEKEQGKEERRSESVPNRRSGGYESRTYQVKTETKTKTITTESKKPEQKTLTIKRPPPIKTNEPKLMGQNTYVKKEKIIKQDRALTEVTPAKNANIQGMTQIRFQQTTTKSDNGDNYEYFESKHVVKTGRVNRPITIHHRRGEIGGYTLSPAKTENRSSSYTKNIQKGSDMKNSGTKYTQKGSDMKNSGTKYTQKTYQVTKTTKLGGLSENKSGSAYSLISEKKTGAGAGLGNGIATKYTQKSSYSTIKTETKKSGYGTGSGAGASSFSEYKKYTQKTDSGMGSGMSSKYQMTQKKSESKMGNKFGLDFDENEFEVVICPVHGRQIVRKKKVKKFN